MKCKEGDIDHQKRIFVKDDGWLLWCICTL